MEGVSRHRRGGRRFAGHCMAKQAHGPPPAPAAASQRCSTAARRSRTHAHQRKRGGGEYHVLAGHNRPARDCASPPLTRIARAMLSPPRPCAPRGAFRSARRARRPRPPVSMAPQYDHLRNPKAPHNYPRERSMHSHAHVKMRGTPRAPRRPVRSARARDFFFPQPPGGMH